MESLPMLSIDSVHKFKRIEAGKALLIQRSWFNF